MKRRVWSDQVTPRLKRVRKGYAKKFGIDPTPDWHLLKVQEEVGEMVSAYLKLTGRARLKSQTKKELKENLRHEIADVVAMTLLFAETQGIDVAEAIEEKWYKYEK